MATTFPVSYTTVSDVLNTLPAINSISNIVSADIAYYAGKVESKMNAKLAKGFALPFTSNINVLTTLSTDLTCYEIMAKRIFTQGFSKDSPWPDRFKEADDMLDDIVSGKVPLLDSSSEIIETKDTGNFLVKSNTQDYNPTMTEMDDTLSTIDPDKLDDLYDDRY